MELEFEKERIKFYLFILVTVLITVVLWGFFLQATQISLEDFFTFHMEGLIEKAFSLNMILFLVLFPLTYAFIVTFCRMFEREEVMIFSTLGALVGFVISVAVFNSLAEFGLIYIFMLISIPLIIEGVYLNLIELRKWIVFRSLHGTMGKGVKFLVIGSFVLGVVMVLPQNDVYVQKFEDTIFDRALKGFGEGEDNKIIMDLSESSTDLVVESQKQTMDMLRSAEVYKNTSDVALKAYIEAANEQINSEEYRQEIFTQMKTSIEKDRGIFQESADIKDEIMELFPFFGLIERFLWLIIAMFISAVAGFVGGVVFTPLGIIYGFILGLIFVRRPEKPGV